MSDLFWLSQAQMKRIEPCFPSSHGVPRVDDHRVLSGIVIRNGLRWRDASEGASHRCESAQKRAPSRCLGRTKGGLNSISPSRPRSAAFGQNG
ncbi:Putative transposase of IS4/5 family [Rhizobium miluonense]|uniref:Putative transposase of IS4/5 family n=1 Tax=Rhizobium miluonense TaxID=411945 RepID=A0A1C3VRV0_9HYPH|nr:Putative transposase of IS4/5 family [Rhizobium miluonense]